MPATSFGTKKSPVHIALWITPQKDSMQQLLGKETLTAFQIDGLVRIMDKS
jgi:hypothetical protein